MSTAEIAPELVVELSGKMEDFPEHRLTVESYLKMVESGVFGRGNRIFLWHGRLVEKMTKGRPHSFTVLKLDDVLGRMIPDGVHIESEQPLRLDDGSLPEPDIMLVRGLLDDYRQRMPNPGDLALIIEVADSSVGVDRGAVLREYAANQIPSYWLVNIPRRRIEVYAEPSGPAESPEYGSRVDYGKTAEVPVILDGHEVGRIVVGTILP